MRITREWARTRGNGQTTGEGTHDDRAPIRAGFAEAGLGGTNAVFPDRVDASAPDLGANLWPGEVAQIAAKLTSRREPEDEDGYPPAKLPATCVILQNHDLLYRKSLLRLCEGK